MNSGLIYTGNFTHTLSVSGFASMQLNVQGNFSGQLLAGTEGTAADPITSITVGGSMPYPALIDVGFLQDFTVVGNMMSGTLTGFGSDPSTPTVQNFTVDGDFLTQDKSSRRRSAISCSRTSAASSIPKPVPTGDFQTLQDQRQHVGLGNHHRQRGGTLMIQHDLGGKVIASGILNTFLQEVTVGHSSHRHPEATQILSQTIGGQNRRQR